MNSQNFLLANFTFTETGKRTQNSKLVWVTSVLISDCLMRILSYDVILRNNSEKVFWLNLAETKKTDKISRFPALLFVIFGEVWRPSRNAFSGNFRYVCYAGNNFPCKYVTRNFLLSTEARMNARNISDLEELIKGQTMILRVLN